MVVLSCGFGELAKKMRKFQTNLDYPVLLRAKKTENVLHYSKKFVLNTATSKFGKRDFFWGGGGQR